MSTDLFDFTRKRAQRERLRKQEEERRKRALEKIETEENDKNDDFVESVLAKAKRAGSVAVASASTATIASKTATTTATTRQHDPRHQHQHPRARCDDDDDDDIHGSSTYTTKKKTRTSLSSHSGSMGSPISLLKQQEQQNRAMALAAQRKSPTDKWLVPTVASSASKTPPPAAKRDLGKWLNASSSIKEKDHAHRSHSVVTKVAIATDTPSSPVPGRHRSRSTLSPPVSPPLLLSQSQDHGCGTTTKSARQPQHKDATIKVAVASWPKKAPCNYSSNDSDSDVDLMAHFEAVNKKKGSLQLSKQGDLTTKPPPIDPLRNDSDENDDVEKRSRIRLDRRTMEDAVSGDERDIDNRSVPPRRKRKLDKSVMYTGDEDNDIESFDHDNERRHGRSVGPRKTNPGKRQQDKLHMEDASSDNDKERQKTKQSFSANVHLPLQPRDIDAGAASLDENGDPAGACVHQDLWSDSSDHEPDSDAETDKKQKRVVRKQKSKKRPSTTKSEGGSRNSRTAYESEDDVQYCDGARGRDLLGLDDTSLQRALHPTLKDPKFDIDPLVPLVLCNDNEEDENEYQVPASINRYLRQYQREGIRFMYKALAANRGVVLGDDMGLGKTIQVLSLLAALFKKGGNGLDARQLEHRTRIVREKVGKFRAKQDEALERGRVVSMADFLFSAKAKEELNLSARWCPVLIVVPLATLENWQREFAEWTHFGVAVFHGARGRERAMERIRNGTAEVMLTPSSCFQGKETFLELKKVQWRMVVIDEFHVFRNAKTQLSAHLRALKAEHRCVVLGMTGTLMQNKHEELWNLIDLVETDFLGSWSEFQQDVANPIKIGRTKTADASMRERAEAKNRALTKKMSSIYLQRKKADVLGDLLPEKNEYVILCELSPLQKRIYQHIRTLPDFDLVQKAGSPCDCRVNQNFFKVYTRLPSAAERLEYYRRHKDEVVKMRECCYDKPYNPRRHEPNQPLIDPDAVLWRFHESHHGDEGCTRCPYCMLLPALTMLYKLSSHVALLQVDGSLASAPAGSKKNLKYVKDTQFARVAFPVDTIDQLAGGSLIRKVGIMDDHFNLSGKMKTLDRLLTKFSKDDSRVLIFSFSTQTMDLIENYLKAKGHKYLRMDGQTPAAKRTELADRFKKDETHFVFLLSTKAMGLGLNLTEANKVIIFDVEWNPSWDAQAQDRAYRIGQTKDVQVIRLVARGTIDELKYLRQLYKVQLKQETLEDVDAPDRKAAPHLFRGVQGDKDRKGELFGCENLFKFKDGSFLEDVWKQTGGNRSSSQKSDGLNIHKTVNVLQDLSEGHCDRLLHGEDSVEMLDQAANEILGRLSSPIDDPGKHEDEFDIVANAVNHQDLFRVDRGRAAIEQGEDGFDEEMGGASQNVVAIYERGVELPIEDPNELEEEFDILANAVNHQDLFRDDRGRAAIEQGEDGFDEEMGGESQNVVALYERGVELPENPQDAAEDAPSDGDLSVSNSPTRRDAQDHTSNRPSPIVVRPMLRAQMDPHRMTDDDAMRRVQQDRAVRKQAADLTQRRKSHSLSDDANADEQHVEGNARDAKSDPPVAEDVSIPLVAKMPENGDNETPIKYQLMGKISTGTHATTLSEADLALPSYGSKRKKKKSKKKSS